MTPPHPVAVSTLSVVVPALNEERNLGAAVESIVGALGDRVSDYELLVFNDCSTDATGAVADGLARENARIRVVHNPRNMGFGYNYTKGVELARMEYVVMLPGDNEVPGASIRAILEALGRADMVIPYIATPWVRSVQRRMISSSFTRLMNVLFGLRVRYLNGPCVLRRTLLQSISLRTHDFAYMAAILVRLIRSGHSYVEVPMDLQPRRHGRSKAFRLKNVASVLRTIGSLFWEVRVRERRRYSALAQRVEFGA
jgi:glycosyltransferase involved in cell wall biosynthesis